MENVNLLIKKYLEAIVCPIVDYPEEVLVSQTTDEMGALLILKVHQKDMGQVVGRQGATANAIRHLVRIYGMKNQARVSLKIEEPEGSTRVRSERNNFNDERL